eukprot:5454042-Prymnesium_polylepis.1
MQRSERRERATFAARAARAERGKGAKSGAAVVGDTTLAPNRSLARRDMIPTAGWGPARYGTDGTHDHSTALSSAHECNGRRTGAARARR